jgi:hypothetical protein
VFSVIDLTSLDTMNYKRGTSMWNPDPGVFETFKLPPDPGLVETFKWPPDPVEVARGASSQPAR